MIRVQRPFFFRGRVPFSKSWLARALILRSIHPQVRILDWNPSLNDGEDVLNLAKALEDLSSGKKEFSIGESGTGLRFLLARLSIEKGEFLIEGSERLLERPIAELVRVLQLLGTKITKLNATRLQINSNGWLEVSSATKISVDGSESSQFRSALLLAATHILDSQRRPQFEGKNEVSRGYLEMTEDLVDQVVNRSRRVLVPEVDGSSIATLAAIVKASAVNLGSTEEASFLAKEIDSLRMQVEQTKQPDRIFFRFHHQQEADLSDAPDLFPILAALAAVGLGPIVLKGAPHLRFKETDRIAEVEKLLQLVGVKFRSRPDGLEITPASAEQLQEWKRRRRQGFAFEYRPPNDHRLAFAATVLAAQGAPIQFHGRGMVAKSFPMFWSVVEGDAPKVAIIGHRGTGKTELAKRWAHLMGARATSVDLDREIERLAGKSTRELYEEDGESEFRFYERKAFREIDEESRTRIGAFVLSCGAGFDTSLIDESWQKIWVRRETDMDGRIFFSRPRLDPELHPREESRQRFKKRNAGFKESADREYWMPEGGLDPAEHLWVRDLFDEDSVSSMGGTITLLPNGNIFAAIERYLRWGVARIEIRDDLFPHADYPYLWKHLASLPSERFLISFRKESESKATLAFIQKQLERTETVSLMLDWPIGPSKISANKLSLAEMNDFLKDVIDDPRLLFVISCHAILTSSLLAEWMQIESEFSQRSKKFVMKLAAETEDFHALKLGHEWAMANPETRVFLPMSPATEVHSRWAWYRLWFGSEVPFGLNFWRDGMGSSMDQPTFSAWWRRERFTVRGNARGKQHFAAVIGEPVHHSRTPLEHDRFFTENELPVFAIAVRSDEWPTAFLLLESMGLKAAAITAPLKSLAAEQVSAPGPINTIVRVGQFWKFTSTDEAGFSSLWKEAEAAIESMKLPRDIVVWGGGGVLPALASTLNTTIAAGGRVEYLRSREPKSMSWSPAIVVWASGTQRGQWPENFEPRLVVDLSYTDDSEGRAIAAASKSRYISGMAMFCAQAEKQRLFWSEYLLNKN